MKAYVNWEMGILVNLIILGAPGAGKGTYASKLASHFGVPAIATGDMFRGEVRNGSPLGKKVAEYLESGRLVPDEVVNEVLKSRLQRPDSASGFILDGYPRTVEQAKALEQIAKIDAVINMDVLEWVIVERLSNRRICRSCGAIYNAKYSPKPKIEGNCDKCGGELYQREDDKPDVIKNRLHVYEKQTQPLIEYYEKKKTKFVTIRNTQVDAPIDVVFQQILDGLKKAKVA